MTKVEFQRKWLDGGTNEIVIEKIRDLTSLIDDERKKAKIDAYTIALRIFEKNPTAFQEIVKSLIEARPPG